MTCREVRDVADSFLSDELLTETNHDILRHLETCPACRADIDARRRLREALRGAFDRAPDLQARAGLTDALREQLRETPSRDDGAWTRSLRWLALAAAVVIVAGLTAVFIRTPPLAPADAIARDAIGDHRNCALKFRLIRKPVPLEQAAETIDSAFRLLMTAPPDDISTPEGDARVLERHSCVYGTRQFGHVVMQYRGRVVSLLMTAADGATGGVPADAAPHLIGRPTDGLSVVSVTGTNHAVLLVSDLDSVALTQLSKAVSVPLAQRVDGRLHTNRGVVAMLFGPPGIVTLDVRGK